MKSVKSAAAITACLVSRCPEKLDQPRGGVETATVALACALRDSGLCTVHIVTLEDRACSSENQNLDGIQVHRLVRSKVPMVADVLLGPSASTLDAAFQRINPDVVHFHESWGLGSFRCKYPHVFTVHGFDSLNLPAGNASGWRWRSRVWNIVESFGLSRQRDLISIAPYVTRELSQRTDARITEIWNSLNASLFKEQAELENKNIVFLGWLNARKNPIVIVKALASIREQHPDAHLYLCGEASDPEYSNDLDQCIAAHNLGNQVTLTGRIDQAAVKAHLLSSAMLVLPSLQENAPMVIAEAMALGVPVIGANRCGIPDMVRDGTDGLLVEPHDVEGLASAIGKLLSSRELRLKMGSEARTQAHAMFHPAQVAQKTLDVYQRLIDDHLNSHSQAA